MTRSVLLVDWISGLVEERYGGSLRSAAKAPQSPPQRPFGAEGWLGEVV